MWRTWGFESPERLSDMSEKTINNLKEYVSFILDLNPLNYVEELMKDLDKMIHQNNSLAIPKDKLNELDTRKSVVNYMDYVTEHEYNLDELMTDFNSVIDSLSNPAKCSADYKASKPVFFYRGQYNAAHSLQTGIYRGKNQCKEDFLYHEMLVRCHDEFKDTSHLEKLVIMQHYGCPTRMLDITSNPLVALFFACMNYGDSACDEGMVFVFYINSDEIAYADSDRALILSCLPKFSIADKDHLIDEAIKHLSDESFPLDDQRYKDEIVEKLYHEISRELPSFKRRIRPIDLLKPLYVQPDKSNHRIFKQDGAFIVSGLNKDCFEEQIKFGLINQIQVRIQNKEQILNDLDKLGINSATLFPDIDNVARYLKSL
jgi:FRG domain.